VGQIILRHLLTMRSGPALPGGGSPWGDNTATYYAPDLRALALERTEVVEAPGRRSCPRSGLTYSHMGI
jgi:CubicO group peptidase (beta-lactamase class C family)